MQLITPGRRRPWARRGLQVALGLTAALFMFRFGLPGALLGGEYIAGGTEVTAQLDSETRFLSTMMVGLSILAVWLVRNFEREPGLAALVAASAGFGGLTRIWSMYLFGLPGAPAIVATVIEVVLPLVILFLLGQREDVQETA